MTPEHGVRGDSRHRHRFLATLVVSFVTVAALSYVSVARAAESSIGAGTGIPIIVTVTAPPTASPSPTPSSSTRPGGSTGGSTSGGSGGSTTVVIGGELPTEAVVPQEDDFSLGGVLYVSGLTTSYQPSLNPAAGVVNAQFTVLNVSETEVDARVRFSLRNVFGWEIGRVTGVAINNLKPSQSRTIDTSIPGAGQWAVTTASFTLTPTTRVDGIELQPLTRDAIVIFVPWLLLMMAALGIGLYAIVRWLRTTRNEAVEEFA